MTQPSLFDPPPTRRPRSLTIPPIASNDDPTTSRTAALRFEPSRTTRVGKVYGYLLERFGCWVDGIELTGVDVGGSEGLRRLRELEVRFGVTVERRPHPNSRSTAWQYRLVSLPTDPSREGT